MLTECRACLSKDLLTFLPLGDHPPANMFVPPEKADEPQPSFPLDTQVCMECGLIEVADQLPADFFSNYLYVPSGAETMHTHFDGLAERLVELADGGLIVDIGCNDGLMLMAANRRGGKTLGIDPAKNIAEHARERGVKVHVGYFGPETAREVLAKHGPAEVISTTNTFNHIGDLHDFMEGVKILLSDTGSFVIEVPRAQDLIDKNEFDTVYHEHVSEFSLLSLEKLGAFFDLAVTDLTKIAVHGGSMRVFMTPKARGLAPSAAVADALAEERASGMLDATSYTDFAGRIEDVGTHLRAMLDGLRAQGLKIAGYGAPAKGNTLLNHYGIGPDRLDFLVDRNPLKQGLLSPGMLIPIHSTDAIAEKKPDVLLVLAWNFFDAIRAQQAEFEAAGGLFLVPLPTPRLIGRGQEDYREAVAS